MSKTEEKEQLILSDEKVFAEGLCFTKLFWVFFVGCIIGFIAETLYCIFIEHKFGLRGGLLYGPFNPVYGSGAVLITLVLSAIPKKARTPVGYFLITMVLGAAFEYTLSVLQEKFFGTVSWQYDDTFWNIGGRTNLAFAACWGFLGVMWMSVIYPAFTKRIERIPIRLGRILTVIACTFMAFNITMSILAASRHTSRRAGQPPSNAVEEWLDQHYPDEVMDRIYPNAVPVDGQK